MTWLYCVVIFYWLEALHRRHEVGGTVSRRHCGDIPHVNKLSQCSLLQSFKFFITAMSKQPKHSAKKTTKMSWNTQRDLVRLKGNDVYIN